MKIYQKIIFTKSKLSPYSNKDLDYIIKHLKSILDDQNGNFK